MGRGRALVGRLMPALLGAQLQICAAAPPAILDPAAQGGSGDFAQALAPRAFDFPRDHGPHPEFRQEWWYLTGNLDATDGERFGFELTFFRVALLPPPPAVAAAAAAAPAGPTSAWRTRQIYVAHFAVTDVARRRFRFQQKLARDALGLAWLDREWGSGGLGPGEAGWDWFALQLEDGSALMFYALRGQDGGREAHSAGTWIGADGAARPLRNADVGITVTGQWRNASGEHYPAAWRIRVPALELDLAVHPALPEQELRTTPPYWEGAVDVSGTRGGAPLGGRGYVELVGYAQER